MTDLVLKKREIDFQAYVKRSAKEEDCTQIIREPSRIIDQDTGEVVVIYGQVSRESQNLFRELKKVKYPVTERTGGLKTTSRIFGAMPRIALRYADWKVFRYNFLGMVCKPVAKNPGGLQMFDRKATMIQSNAILRHEFPSLKFRKVEGKPWDEEPDMRSVP